MTAETDFGDARKAYWHGVDFNATARLASGLTVQGGTSTGGSLTDTCASVVFIDSPDPRGCHNEDPFQTTVRGLATYTVPKVDVLVSMTVRSQPPVTIGGTAGTSASWIVPNSIVQAALGHLPVGALANGTTTIQLTDNANRVYADNRRTQIDMRFAKVIRLGRTRSDIGIDLNNLLNTNYATGYTSTYSYSVNNALQGGTWAAPTSIYTPRFVRFNYTLNF